MLPGTPHERHALPGHLQFRDDPSGLVFAEVDNDHASATICLQGAHLVIVKVATATHDAPLPRGGRGWG